MTGRIVGHGTVERPSSHVRIKVAGGLAVVFVVILISLMIGTVGITPINVVKGLLGTADDPVTSILIRDFRLPRILVGAAVGAQIAVSGAILQAVTRNALAAPSLVGVSAGAGLAAVMMVLFVPSASVQLVGISGFFGALLAGTVVYALSWKGGISPERLALTGIAVTAILAAFITAIVTFYADNSNVQAALVWLTGTVYGRGWDELAVLAPWFIGGLALAVILAPKLNLLILGDSVAAGLGMRVELARLVFIALAIALAASAVAVAGLVAFVGLVVPHVVRMIFGSDHRIVVPLSAIGGAILMMVADDVARTAFGITELPAGLFTALIGAPYFIYLIARSKADVAL
jgi:ABC-type Fe3+-siderophore transport system permease subunit